LAKKLWIEGEIGADNYDSFIKKVVALITSRDQALTAAKDVEVAKWKQWAETAQAELNPCLKQLHEAQVEVRRLREVLQWLYDTVLAVDDPGRTEAMNAARAALASDTHVGVKLPLPGPGITMLKDGGGAE
jgi:hypothetical protein